MTRYRILAAPPDGWTERCVEQGALFGSTDWQRLLEKSFGARTLYAWDGNGGAALTIFVAGPFRVGYLGFPAGACVGIEARHADIVSDLQVAKLPIRLTCLRVPVSPFDGPGMQGFKSSTTPETAIADLAKWEFSGIAQKVRRIRKAERAGVEVVRAADAATASRVFELYAGAVKRQGGSLRYNERYFRSLIDLGMTNRKLRVSVATLDGAIAGFLVTATHSDTAYYLHGGTSSEFRKLSPSDLLMADAIRAAQSDGVRCFNFMASPANQPSLVRYKEKFGGETRTMHNYTVPLSASFPAFILLERIYRLIR